MAYFVTGATGFIGRYLVENLLRRGRPVYVLVRKGSEKKLSAMRKRWGADDKQVIGIEGDLAKPGLGRGCGRPPEAQRQDRPLLPPRRDLRPQGQRRGPADRQRRRHEERGALRRGGPGRMFPPRELDRRRGALRRHVPRRHVRGGRRPRPPVLQDQARLRGRRAPRAASGRSASIVPGSSSATRRPGRSTRSTARTISSRRCRNCATCCRPGCR